MPYLALAWDEQDEHMAKAHKVHLEGIQTLFFHFLLHYSFILKLIICFSSSIYTQYPKDKAKTDLFRFFLFYKCITFFFKWYGIYYKTQLSSSASCFHVSSLIFLQHQWSIQLVGHDLEGHTPVYIRSHSWQCISEQKPSHEVEGIVRSAPIQDCVEAQIWGRVPKHFCSIEGPQEHSGLHHS